MNRFKLGGGSSHLALACAATALLAAGCNRTQTAATTAPPLDALPLTTNTTAAADPAPAGSALPAAAPVRIARLAHPREGYAYLDRAYAASDGYADAPPDYAVDYNGERPWIWRGGDNSERVVERTPAGLRYYYYEPGASEPYLIQDPDYGYAYSDGQLVAVYGQDGQLEPYDIEQRRASQAGRYLAWAAGLYAASQHQQRVAVEQAHWNQQQAYVAGQRNAWAQQQARYPAWNDYHQAHAQEETAHWAPERDRRQAELVRYGAPQNNGPQGGGGYQGPEPQGGYPNPGGNRGQDQGQFRQGGQAYGQPGGHPPAGAPQSGYGYDPNGARNAAGQAEAARQASLNQQRAAVQAQRQGAEQAHAAQVQAMQAQQAQARTAEVQRQTTLQQGRASEQAQRQAAEQAHTAQMQATRSRQLQAQAAEGQRQATLQQTRAEAENQRQAAQQAHAAQMGQQHAQAAAEHQAAMQQAQAANAQRQAAAQQVHTQAQAQHQAAMQQQAAQHAAQPHPGAPPPHEAPHGDHDHHPPGEQR